MGIGDAPLPVASGVEANNPVPATGNDQTNDIDDRVKTLERAGNAELVRYIRYLYDLLSEPFPPP